MRMKSPFLLASLAALFLFSCGNDYNGPLITINEPLDGDVISLGTTLHVEAGFEDISALGQFKIELQGTHTDLINEMFLAYDTVLHIGSLSGSADSIHLHFVLPDTVLPGPYVLKVSALDELGNETTESRNLTFQKDLDTRAPVVTINSPVSMQALAGDTVQVNAGVVEKLSDNLTDGQLHYIEVYLQSASNAALIYNLGTYTHQNGFSGYYNSGVFARTFSIPGSAAAGNYYLYIVTRDIYYNRSENFVQVQLL